MRDRPNGDPDLPTRPAHGVPPYRARCRCNDAPHSTCQFGGSLEELAAQNQRRDHSTNRAPAGSCENPQEAVGASGVTGPNGPLRGSSNWLPTILITPLHHVVRFEFSEIRLREIFVPGTEVNIESRCKAYHRRFYRTLYRIFHRNFDRTFCRKSESNSKSP